MAPSRIAIVAPSSPFDRSLFDQGLGAISRRFKVTFSERLFSVDRYLAGSDPDRRAEFQTALDADDVRAICVARGGYGAMRLLPRLKWPTRPKILVGFSDVTALHACAQKAGWRSIHGPVVTQLAKQPASVISRLVDLLEGKAIAPLSGTATFASGIAEGPLIGGNLSVLTSLIGTPYMPPLRGAILLLEDVGERPYRIDRMMTHLILSGLLEGVAGIVLGEFTACEEKDADYSSEDVLRSQIEPLGVPCVAGFPIGHGDVNQPVPLGARVTLDADEQSLTFLEGVAK